MRILLAGMMALLLLRAPETMAAAEAACVLFVRSVMPGLFPYLTMSQMLVSRCGGMPPGMTMLLGWCGGSPTGARLLAIQGNRPRREQKALAISCATMSPMFLLGTIGSWLNSRIAGAIILLSVLAGGYCAGRLAKRWTRVASAEHVPETRLSPVSFARAVEDSARTMLLVCGTMTMLRVFAALTDFLPDALRLPLTTLLEVTTGAVTIANLPMPLPLRMALLSAATGFGGCAVIMQNRALYPSGLMRLGEQIAWQVLHGVISGALALGIALLVLGAGGNL